MTYFCTLASGSEGNCYVYVSGRQRILVDAGKNTRYINQRLGELALSVGDLTHILITHSHSDHVSALPVLLKHTRATLVCSHGTFTAIASRLPCGVPVTLFQPGEELALGEIPAKTFSTSHDAPGSCGYVLGRGAEQVAVCTDLGTMSGDLFETIRGSGTVLLECNHDVQRLWNGPYPYPLKQRILSDRGHLSNAFSAKVAVRLCQTGTRRLLLAHLSAENNTPQLALSAVRGALEQAGLEAHVALAPRSALGEPILL
ncbi:MAG: MBL fold metallo-hydrolase [Clostridia bacterium]|nr:MBL fold metallo-hydrolase [Clostridia bacterium]